MLSLSYTIDLFILGYIYERSYHTPQDYYLETIDSIASSSFCEFFDMYFTVSFILLCYLGLRERALSQQIYLTSNTVSAVGVAAFVLFLWFLTSVT